MKILVSNDDGIDSKGIYALATALKSLGEVVIVAPLMEQSAAGHSITMKRPLRVIEYYKNNEFFGYAVDGTPADCVKMSIRYILQERPDIVVSGINHGSNTATNIIYSGTVSAAREAAIMDLPAAAFSITSRTADNIADSAQIAKKVVEMIIEKGLKKGTMLNVNIPDLPISELKGVKWTKQGCSKWDDLYEKRIDPTGKDYFWIMGQFINLDPDTTFDEPAVLDKFVSITPIQLDMTDHDTLAKMQDWKLEL